MSTTKVKPDYDWQNKVLPAAARIVRSYGRTLITLRQLFYLLVSLPPSDPGHMRNNDSDYHTLARVSAAARRGEGRWAARPFPRLLDTTRTIHTPAFWADELAGILALTQQWRSDRTLGQPYQLWIVTEKKTMVGQLRRWFGPMGIHVVALGGQGSEPIERAIMARVQADGRPAILIYVGDHDPAGWRIPHVFVKNTGCWDNPELPEYPPTELDAILGYTKPASKSSKAQPIPNYALDRKYRVALLPEQCRADEELDIAALERNSAKDEDPNNQSFLLNFPAEQDEGELPVQIELDAVEPNRLREMLETRVDEFWDYEAYSEVLDAERGQRHSLRLLHNHYGEALAYVKAQYPDEAEPPSDDDENS